VRAGERVVRRLLGIALALLIVAGGWLALRLRDRPGLGGVEDLLLDAPPRPGAALAVTFFGVSTLLFTDGETSLMTDGFFSRPGLVETLAGRIEPDRPGVAKALEAAGIDRLAALFVVHSHYDHAMDAAEVARRTGAVVVGSESTAQIARGDGLAEAQIRVVRPGEAMDFGRFRVTMLRSRHFPHGMAMGEIREPLRPPARATAYLEGGSYSVLVEHPLGRVLVQGSAGFEPGALRDVRADLVLLGIGLLGTREREFTEAYWRETVRAVAARRVIPIHWDDFTRPFAEPLQPMPRLLDDFEASLGFLRERAAAEGVELRFVAQRRPLAALPARAASALPGAP
jgi:L-ascorbate metabolism protein UlaG (beta-lactamase superfamily)